jgi:hypothetical protein
VIVTEAASPNQHLHLTGASTSRRAHDHAARGPSRSVGCIPADLRGRNAPRLYVCGRGRSSVRRRLDAARDLASRRAPTSETRRTVR